MKSSLNRWRNLFLFCLGVSIATYFIMEWLASDFWWHDERFSILGLELFYSKKEVITILTEIKQPAKIALNYQLIFDFAFMAGVYPGIASLCMMAREKIIKKSLRNILFALAMLQPIAWVFDIVENGYLLKWIDNPEIGDEFSIYHNMVALKWLIALAGALLSIIILSFRSKEQEKIQPNDLNS